MRIERRKAATENSELFSFTLWFCVFSFSLLGYLSGPYCWAVTSKLTRHSSSEDLLKGRAKDVVVGSEGTLQLGRAAEVIVEKFEAANAKKSISDPWSLNR